MIAVGTLVRCASRGSAASKAGLPAKPHMEAPLDATSSFLALGGGERSRNMRLGCRPALLCLVLVAAVVSWDSTGAPAQTRIRLGKAQAQNFAFLAADVGLAAGIFKQHGIDLEIANFGGDARLVQA